MTNIKKFTIFGERCTGTNYLENLILKNFEVELTWKYGFKHFFGFLNDKLKDSDDTLFICITRNIHDWMNSLFINPHHLNDNVKLSIDNFCNNQIYSIPSSWICKGFYGHKWSVLGEDRNIYSEERYKNIFEMRHIKHKFLIDDLPKRVKNYIFIKYEDLVNNFDFVMNKIKNKGLKVIDKVTFPININKYKNEDTEYIPKKYSKISNDIILKNKKFNKHYENISNDIILKNKNFNNHYEKILNYL